MGGVKAAAEPDPFAAINHLAHQGCATYGPSRQGIPRPSGVVKVDREIDPEFDARDVLGLPVDDARHDQGEAAIE